MAENLRDLVVSLSLDGDNFSRNIKSINAQIREAESEFKAAGAGVSDFEGTLGGAQAKAQMLSQKLALQEKAVEQYARALDAAKSKLADSYSQHEQLARALDDAKAKHQELAAAQGEDSEAARAAADEVKKLEGQLRTNERQLQTNADAVTKATTGLNAAKGALSETQRALSDTEKELARQKSAWQQAADALSEFSEKATRSGEKMTALGKNLSIGVTAPITAIGAACYKAFGEVDDGLDTIITKTGASGKALDGLEKSYENVFGSMPVTAGDAATAIGEVNTRFGLLDKALEDTSARFIKFSKINGVDLNGSIDDVDAIMTKFGVDAGEVGDVLDYMTKVGQDTGINLSALMGSLKANGSSLKELGLDLGESITLLAQFESNGVDASAALAGMKKAVQEATADGKSADKALAETVAAIKNAKTETEALTIAAELFGSKGAAEMAGAIREGRVNIDQLSVSMSKYAGVVNETFEATLDLPDQATVAMNKLKIAGKELASSAMTALEPVVSTLIEKAQGLLEKFQAMDEGTKQRIAKIAAIVALVGPSIALIGKLTGTVGTVTGAISKFSGAVAAAGGGLKGLGTVLASSPALWLAAAAAVGYALYKLIDWISGAKAAREAMEALQNTAKSWKGAMADTFYSSSKGLDAYGISAERFVRRYSQAEGWLREVTEDWKDDLIESDETVEKYVSSFKAMTSATRDSLDEMRKTAQTAGYTAMETQLQADMAALDSVDSQIEALLKKRQETFLTEEDKQELARLVKQHEEIEVKYKLVEADEGSGFDEIAKEVENARARASAAGKEVSAQVYEDAMVASAEGYAALNKSIDAEYDKRYELIKLMEDEGQKTKAQAELDAWYNGERLAAATEYAAALGMVADEEGKTLAATMLSRKSMTDTYRDLNDLRNLLADGDYGTDNINQINDVFSRMSEGELVELISLTEQINSLKDAGLHTDTIADMLGLDEGQIQMLEMVNSLLADVQKQLDIHDTTEALDPLREMFGGQLGEEVVKIATDLDLTGAKDRWAEFAEDPGAIVQTDAEVTSVTGRGKTFTVTNATVRTAAQLNGVTGDGQTFMVTNATINADGTLTGVDGNGKTFTATNVTVNADGTLTGVTGDGKTFTVQNATIQTSGVLTGVTGDGKTFTVTNATVNADGTLTGVDGNGRTFTARNVTVNADGTLTGVTGDGKTFTVKNATVNAVGTLTGVTGDGKTFTVTNAIVNADGTLTGVDGNGRTFTARNVTVNADGTLTGVTGDGKTFTVKNATVNAEAALTGVTGDGKTFTVMNATVNADGTLTGVDGNGKTFTATNVTVNADGTLTGVTGDGKTFTVKNATVQAAAALTVVTGDGKTFTVTNATINADGTLTGVDGEGKTFTATNVTVNANGTLSGVDGNGRTFTATNATATVSATVTGVTGDGKTFTVTNATVNADGTLTGVDGEGKTFTATNVTVKADGTLTGVTGEGKTFAVKNATVQADGSLVSVSGGGKTFTVTNATVWTSSGVTLDDLTAAAIEDWQKRNASKVTLTSKVYAPVQATLGDDWQKDLGDLWNKGLLEVYSENGMPMRVTPELISTLSGQDLVLGTDSKGVYHIMVKPEWMNAEAQDVGNLVNEVRSATAAAKKYNDAYWEYYRSGPSADDANIFQKAGSFLEGWFVGFDEPRVKDRELEDIAAVLKKTAAAYESGVDLSGVEGLTEALGEATKLMDSGYYEDWVNSLVTDLNAMGIDVRASTLADYYNRVNYKNADAARRKQLEEDVAAYKELREAQKAAEDEARRQQHEEEYNPYYGFTDDERAQQAQKDLKDTLGVLEDFYQARLETEGDYWEAWGRMSDKYGSDWEQQYMSYDKLQQMAEVYNQYKAALEEGIELSPEQVDFMRGLEVALQAMTGETGFNDLAEKIGYDVSAGIGVGELSYDWNPDAGAMAQSMLSAIQNATGSHSPATKFVPVGENIAQGVALGITNGTALVTAAITAMAQAAIAAAKEALGIHSPSKVFRDELGRMAMRGFGEGIKVGSLEQAEVVRNAAGYLTGEARLAVAGNTVNNYTSDARIDFAGATFQVRDQQDIHALAGEIAALIKRQQAGRGAK